MATAAPTRKKAPARKRKGTGPPAKGQSPTDLLQGALDDLTAARERASDDIRSGIDSAIDHTRDALQEAGSEAQAQVGDWRRSLEKTSDDIRRGSAWSRSRTDLPGGAQCDVGRDPQAEGADRADQVIDLHCHILPGLDDGARDLEDSVAMARQAEADGIERVCATPHIRHDHDVRRGEMPGGSARLERRARRRGVRGPRADRAARWRRRRRRASTTRSSRAVSLGGGGRWILLEPAPGPLGGLAWTRRSSELERARLPQRDRPPGAPRRRRTSRDRLARARRTPERWSR